MEMTRRQTLAAIGALAAAASLPHVPADAKSKQEKTMRAIGVQLFMVRHLLEKDFEGTLGQIAAIGYREIEIHNFYGRSGTEIRRILDGAGLSCPGAHVPLDPRFPGMPGLTDPATVEMLQQIGVKHAVVPLFPLDKVNFAAIGTDMMKLGTAIWNAGETMTLDDWKRFAHGINEAGVELAKLGMTIGYHNHNLEFARLPDGSMPLEVLMRETDPANVKMELDIGWAAAAGIDVPAFMQKHATRINQLHIKDTAEVSGTGFKFTPARMGEGIVDWNALMPMISKLKIDHLYVEQEEPFAAPALEEARIAFEFMRKRPELKVR